MAAQWNAAVKPPFTVLLYREHITESQVSKVAMDHSPCEEQLQQKGHRDINHLVRVLYINVSLYRAT